jgi:hypothetical protein
MTKYIDIINAAVELIIKAAILAASFSGRVRKRSLKRLAKMDVDSKDKEIIFPCDAVDRLKTQIAVLRSSRGSPAAGRLPSRFGLRTNSLLGRHNAGNWCGISLRSTLQRGIPYFVGSGDFLKKVVAGQVGGLYIEDLVFVIWGCK